MNKPLSFFARRADCALCRGADVRHFGFNLPARRSLTSATSHQSLQSERALVSDSVVAEHGEMPLADVKLPAVHEEPLGDVARRYRQMSRDAQASATQPILRRSTGAFPGWWLAN